MAALKGQVSTLTTVNRQLVDTVAKLVADVGALDPANVVAELKDAIAGIQVRLDVAP